MRISSTTHFILALLLLPLFAFGQKHDYNWLFGYDNNSSDARLGGAVIDFNHNPPKIYPDTRKVDLFHYHCSCSDSSGRLAFYTNGISIRDRTHEKMLFGDTLNPVPLWVDWQNRYFPSGPYCLTIPAPGRKNHYYMFHLAAQYEPIEDTREASPFYYTLIDMNGNNGLGKVTSRKNRVLIPKGDLVPPVATKHGNGRDWWVVTGVRSTNKIYTFLITPSGVQGPFLTEMPYNFPGREYAFVNTMSPDGRLYVRCSTFGGLYILNFNRCTGVFSNLRVVPFGPDISAVSVIVSKNSKYLYFSAPDKIMALDLTAPDLSTSLDTLAYFDGFSSPMRPYRTGFFIPSLGPNGKIYYATTNSTMAMHYIHRPDWPGQSADLEQHGLQLPKFNNGTMGLFPNYRLGEWQDAPCDTLQGQRPNDGFEYSQFSKDDDNNTDGKFYYKVFTPLGDPAKRNLPRRKQEDLLEIIANFPTQPSFWNQKH